MLRAKRYVAVLLLLTVPSWLTAAVAAPPSPAPRKAPATTIVAYPPQAEAVCDGGGRIPKITGRLSVPAESVKVETNFGDAALITPVSVVARTIDAASGQFTVWFAKPLDPGNAVRLTPSKGAPRILVIAACPESTPMAPEIAHAVAAGTTTNVIPAAADTQVDGLIPTTLDPISVGDTSITGKVSIKTPSVSLQRPGHEPLIPAVIPDANGRYEFTNVTPLAHQEWQAIPKIGKPSAIVEVKDKAVDPKSLAAAIVSDAFAGDSHVKGQVKGDSGKVALCINDAVCADGVSPDKNGVFDIAMPSPFKTGDSFRITQEKGKDTPTRTVKSRPVVDRVLSDAATVTGTAANAAPYVKYCLTSKAICRSVAAINTDAQAGAGYHFSIPVSAATPFQTNDTFVIVQSDGVESLVQTVLARPTVKTVKAGTNTVEGTVANGETLVRICTAADTACRMTTITADLSNTVAVQSGKFSISLTDSGGDPKIFKQNEVFVVLASDDPPVESTLQQVAPPELTATFSQELKEGTRIISGNAPGADGVQLRVYRISEQGPTGGFRIVSASVGSGRVEGRADYGKVRQVTIERRKNDGGFETLGTGSVDKDNNFAVTGFTLKLGDDLRAKQTCSANCIADITGWFRVGSIPNPSDRPVEIVDQSVTNGQFSAILPSILSENESVAITPYKNAGTEKVMGLSTPEKNVNSAEYDWGRVRAYFSLGAITGKDDNNYSKYHPYVSLNVDYNWIHHTWDNKHLLVNTYFEGRLTNTPTTAFSSTSNQLTLLSSDASAHVETGIYLPFNTNHMSWYFRNQRQVLFLAPIAKGGFVTVSQAGTASVNGTCSTTPGSRTYTADCRDTVALDNSNIFSFYSGGLRVGHYYQPKQMYSVGPRLIDYLDLTYGRFSNLPSGNLSKTGCSVALASGSSLPNTPIGVSGECLSVPWRFQATGRMAIPLTPFTIGFNAIVGKGPDVMQFFLGTRFDIAPLLQKLLPSASDIK